MNIVLLDDKDVKRSYRLFLDLYLPGIQYFDAGDTLADAQTNLRDLDVWLKCHEGKTAIITAGTLDAMTDDAGSAYDVVTKWLMNTTLKRELHDTVCVIAHPSFEDRAKPGFVPFDILKGIATKLGVEVYSHPKAEGPYPLTETIQKFFGVAPTAKERRSSLHRKEE